MTASLEGISLHVTDIERSIDFYSRIPGVEMVFQRPGQFARFRVGTGFLHLVHLPGPTRFHVELDTEDLDGMYDRLTEVGIKPQSRPTKRPWGQTDFRVIDPDGNMLDFGVAEATTTPE